MGILSGKKQTTVQSIAQRMLEDTEFKYAHKLAVEQWIWDTSGKPIDVSFNKVGLSDYILEYNSNALPKKFNNLLRHCKKPNKYKFGLPKSEISTDTVIKIKQATKEHLESMENTAIDVVSFYIAVNDLYYKSWVKLINDYGYDFKTNKLNNLTNDYSTDVYLVDGYLKLSDRTHAEYVDVLNNNLLSFGFGKLFDTRQENISREPKPAVINTDDDKDYLVLQFAYKQIENQVEVIKEETLKIDISDFNPLYTQGDTLPKEYESVYVFYKVGHIYKFFNYKLDSGGLPKIDNAIGFEESIGLFYPRLHIRVNQQDSIDSKDKTIQKDIKKAFKVLGLDAKQTTNQIKSSIGDNYNDCRGILIHIGASINTTNKDSVSEYCFRYFDRLYKNYGKNITDTRKSGLIQNIKDSVSNFILTYDWIEKKVHTGVFKLGTVDLKPDEFCITHKQYTDESQAGVEINKQGTVLKPKQIIHRLVKQVDENNYITIDVANLTQVNNMSGYNATHTGTNVNLVIPVDAYLIKELSNKEKQTFFHKCLHIQIMFAKVTKGKWWQRGAFKVMLTVIGVAIGVAVSMSGGATFAQALLKGVLGAVKGAVVAQGSKILISVGKSLGLSDKVINALQFIATVVVALKSANWDFSKILTAPNIMKAINSSFQAFSKQLQLKTQQVMGQMSELMTRYKTESQRLQQLQKLLDTQVMDLTLEQMTSSYVPSVDPFETPELFIARHNNYNVVDVSLGLITNLTDGLFVNQIKPYKPKTINVEEVLLIT